MQTERGDMQSIPIPLIDPTIVCTFIGRKRLRVNTWKEGLLSRTCGECMLDKLDRDDGVSGCCHVAQMELSMLENLY